MNDLGVLIGVGVVAGALATIIIAIVKGLVLRFLHIEIDRRMANAISILVCFSIGFIIEFTKNGGDFANTVAQSSVIFITAQSAYEFITRPTGLNEAIENKVLGE